MKHKLHWKLTLLRDKDWVQPPLLTLIDWLRYGVLNQQEDK